MTSSFTAHCRCHWFFCSKQKKQFIPLLSLSLSNSSYQERIQSFPFDHEHSLQYMCIVRSHLDCSSIQRERIIFLVQCDVFVCSHTWIVKWLVDIVWLTRVLLCWCSPINWPFFSQLMRANGRLNAWHSIVTFRYCALWIKSFFTDTIGGSKSKQLILLHFIRVLLTFNIDCKYSIRCRKNSIIRNTFDRSWKITCNRRNKPNVVIFRWF